MNLLQSPPLPHVRIGDMVDNDARPAKRMRLASATAHNEHQRMANDIATFDVQPPPDDLSFAWPVSPGLDQTWSWRGPSTVSPAPEMLLPLGPHDLPTTWAPEFGVSPQLLQQPTLPTTSDFTVSPTTLSFSAENVLPPSKHGPAPPQSNSAPMVNVAPRQRPATLPRPSTVAHKSFSSPFVDCIETFGTLKSPRFMRPMDGRVNGYVKFNWPRKRERESGFVEEIHDDSPPESSSRITSPPTKTRESSISGEIGFSKTYFSPVTTKRRASAAPILTPSSMSPSSSSTRSPLFSNQTITDTIQLDVGENPQFIPPHFGYDTRMDATDRGLWKFYINNWCPGRSVLGKTNLWLTDFAQMHGSAGVSAAIQSLAGIYVYDYQPNSIVRRRVNDRFAQAEQRFTDLLQLSTAITKDEVSELITIASLLSMQDIVLVERRLKRPHEPRWLQGFKQSEHFLQLTDPGSRFWHTQNVQLDTLRISQSVIVGRAVILAQPMMPLPDPETFDSEAEVARFGWLLYGSPQDVHEVHGGCGFSKKLLHIFSQITFCAARLNQDPKTPLIPRTAERLYNVLAEMRQWSRETTDWEKARTDPQPISWIVTAPENYTITTSQQMTDVTAEAWRLAAMLYLQCRLLRLPRNHPEVLTNLDHLTKAISVMPTSGHHFTAQAPLFPVFLLGLLATQHQHSEVARLWFESVVTTPVRSSVPPLYEALQRILQWVDVEVESSICVNSQLPYAIADRLPWWEHLMAKLEEKEEEVLCLT